MKKLLFIAILTLIGCSAEEIDAGNQLDCNCGTIMQKTYLPDGRVILKVKNDCNGQLKDFEFPQNVPYNINEKYCY
jgi:hypothetical protein